VRQPENRGPDADRDKPPRKTGKIRQALQQIAQASAALPASSSRTVAINVIGRVHDIRERTD
jgi:hypothetical protein